MSVQDCIGEAGDPSSIPGELVRGSLALSHVSDVAAIVHPQKKKCNMGDIYLVNVGRQGIRCLLVVTNGVGVAT